MVRLVVGLLLAMRLLSGGSAAAADDATRTVETYFVVVDDAPIRDATSGKPLGKLERGAWLQRWTGETSFRCYDPWRERVTVEADHALPLDEARKFFSERLKKRPNAEDYADRGAIALREEAYAEALADLNQALKLDPNLYRALQRRADCRHDLAIGTGDWEERRRLVEAGLKDVDRCVELRPDSFMGYDTRYLLKVAALGPEATLDDLKKALELRPNHPPLYSNRAKLLIDLGRDEEALADLNRAIELAPDYSEAHTNRGIIYYRRREFDRAIEEAALAIKFNPLNTSAWCNRGNAYTEVKEFEKAIADFEEAVRLAPQHSDGHFGLASVYFAWGNETDADDYVRKGLPVPTGERRSTESLRKALEACEAALKRHPADYQCLHVRGNVLKKLDKPDEAIESFKRAMEAIEKESRIIGFQVRDANGDRHDVWDAVGKTLWAVDRPETFNAAAQRIALAHPHRRLIATIMANRADAYRMRARAGDPTESAAVADLSRALMFDPDNADYYRDRGLYKLEFKRYHEAIDDLTRAAELRPNDTGVLRGRVLANIELKFFDKAWDDARKIEKLGSPLDTATLDRLKKLSGRDR